MRHNIYKNEKERKQFQEIVINTIFIIEAFLVTAAVMVVFA